MSSTWQQRGEEAQQKGLGLPQEGTAPPHGALVVSRCLGALHLTLRRSAAGPCGSLGCVAYTRPRFLQLG